MTLVIPRVQSRPIDRISTWIQYGETVCWLAAPYETCCALALGPKGNPNCWVAEPLSFENCCLERWRVCDDVVNVAPALSAAWLLFYETCAYGQRLLNSLHALAVNIACESDACKEEVQAKWESFEHSRSDLARRHWHRQLELASKIDERLLLVLDAWPPHSFVQPLAEITGTSAIQDLEHRLEPLHDDLERFRDAMLEVLYSSYSQDCGDWCNASLVKDVNCNALLGAVQSQPAVPPPSIPPRMREAFTMRGQVPVIHHSRIREALGFHGGAFPLKEVDNNWLWSKGAVEEMIAKAYSYTLTPGPNSLDRVRIFTDLLLDLPSLPRQQHWLVWGHNKHFEWWKPWMEALLLAFGARGVASVVPDPKRYQLKGHDLRAVTEGEAEILAPFHGIILMGVSSAGIGRHGDELDPNLDLKQAAKAWCFLPSGGILIVPPMTDTDLLRWPLNRVYGPLRWPHLVANFRLLRVYPGVAAVMQKP